MASGEQSAHGIDLVLGVDVDEEAGEEEGERLVGPRAGWGGPHRMRALLSSLAGATEERTEEGILLAASFTIPPQC